MKKVFVLIAVLSLMLVSAGISFAASSAGDNFPGGAGVATFRVGNGFTTLINIQHRPDVTWTGIDGCGAVVHVAIYDVNSQHIIDFNLNLTRLDNVGVVITSGTTAGSINIYDYSDNAFGGNPVINSVASGIPIVAAAPAQANGDILGYVTMVRNNNACSGAGFTGTPIGTISGVLTGVPDSLFIRTAYVGTTSAYAFNSPMLQGFINIPAANANGEALHFVDTFGAAAANNPVCDADGSGVIGTVANGGSLDDGNGANIDFWEMLITNSNGFVGVWGAAAGIVCDADAGLGIANRIYNALGVPGYSAANSLWWGRFNVSTIAGTASTLVLTSPNYAPRAAYRRSNNLSVLSYNDDEIPVSFGPVAVPEVASIAFGSASGNINPGTAVAGEALINYNTPAFGYTYTSTAAFADVYPLVRDRAAGNICDASLKGQLIAGVAAPVALAIGAGQSCVVVAP